MWTGLHRVFSRRTAEPDDFSDADALPIGIVGVDADLMEAENGAVVGVWEYSDGKEFHPDNYTLSMLR